MPDNVLVFFAAEGEGELPIDYDAPAPEGGDGGEYAMPAEGEEGAVGLEGAEEYPAAEGALEGGEMPPVEYGVDGTALPTDDGNYGAYAAAGDESHPVDAYGVGDEYGGGYAGGEQPPAESAYGAADAYGADAYGGGADRDAADPYSMYGATDGAAPAVPSGVDVEALLAGEREKHEQQLKMETQAREVGNLGRAQPGDSAVWGMGMPVKLCGVARRRISE